MWGGLGDMLIEKRTRHVGHYPIVLTVMSVKLYNNKIYLSSTSSTLIVDDEQIPVLKRLKTDDSGVELTKEMLPADNTTTKAETLENLLMWARNRKYDSSTFHCVVKIDKLRKRRVGTTHHAVEKNVRRVTSTARMAAFMKIKITTNEPLPMRLQLPTCRYRLELEISNDTAETVVVMFDETVRSLVKCSASSIMGSEDQIVREKEETWAVLLT
ncbi:hypothetical protein Tco_0359386 [Tanacetum coccineum]